MPHTSRPLPLRDPSRRSGRLNPLYGLLLAAAVVVVLLAVLLRRGGPTNTGDLTMYTAAGLKPPVEEIVQQYEQEFNVKVTLQYGGSNTLLGQLKADRYSTPDLYLAADQFYLDEAVADGLAAEVLPIGAQFPVIAVPKGNPRGINSINDLLADDVMVVTANPNSAAIGRAVKDALEAVSAGEQTLWDRLEQHVADSGVFKDTVNYVANDVKIGAVDAGIVWNTTVASPKYRDSLEAVVVPELEPQRNEIGVAVLKSSQRPSAALHFARYLTARNRGLEAFKEIDVQTVDGDVWEDPLEITFYCGAVNRRAIEETLAQFEEREGVTINTIYDGCGILTSRMKTIDGQRPELGFPDVYMACDRYYLENVHDWFQEDVDVSDTEIVIAVPKGSTKVQELADLVKPGVRVAVGEPKQCTIGALSRMLLQEEGLYEQLLEKQDQEGEVVVFKSSSALLVPDVLTGSVDAAIAYITDVQSSLDEVDIIHVNSPRNLAIQPFSVARSSDHKYLVRRLFAAIADSQEKFEEAGFHFRLNEDSPTSSSEGSPGEGENPL